jgi:hypothetical protein
MMSSTTKKGSLEELFSIIYDTPDFGVYSIVKDKFDSTREVINFNIDLYDNLHGKNGWKYNLLTGKLEK